MSWRVGDKRREGGASAPGRWGAALLGATALVAAACAGEPAEFNPERPARGPGQLVGNGEPVSDGFFAGGDDALPSPRADATPPEAGELPVCGAACQAFCDQQGLENPVNQGLCRSLWGAGVAPRPIDGVEACRRLHVDLLGRFPTAAEVGRCVGRPWGEVARELMADEAFVLVNQRRWADKLLYNNQAVSLERIYDMDDLVGKLYAGRVAYDQFAAVVSAHPVLTRRFSTSGDRAEFLFNLFLGRPPLGSERSDFGRLYALWSNGYYDHPALGMRLPDAVIAYRCVDEAGAIDPARKGECTSVTFGYHELILEPDLRADADGQMWSGALSAEEWGALQLPGRLLAQQPRFWEALADDVLELYLGYDLGTQVPEVRDALVRYVLAYNGDVRALHFAVVTSAAYLQSAAAPDGAADAWRWTYGPLKQVEVEPWLDSIKAMTGYDLTQCDHRLPQPGDLLSGDVSLAALALVTLSRWELTEESRVRTDYRDLARGLGGCPANEVGERFKTVSILTTATQTNFVAQVCNPGLEPNAGADAATLLPEGMNPATAVDEEVAEAILRFQSGAFLGREPEGDEVARAREAASRCALCRAEEFARPTCYAILSSAEMLFY